MKKSFSLVQPKIQVARMFDASKHEINKKIDEVEKLEQTSFYIEILAKPEIRKNAEDKE